MANPTLTIAAEPDNWPPRVRIDITDTGTPAVSKVTVLRTNPNGERVPVRTQDGDVLTLSTSGSTRVGTLYDYEPPLGVLLSYGLAENPATVGLATVDSEQVWLVHPGVPSRSMVVRVMDMSGRERPVRRGVFWPMGRDTAIVNTDGRRKAGTGALQVRTKTLADMAAMEALLADAQTLLLNVPAGLQWGVAALYVAIGDVTEDRLSNVWGSHPWRTWNLPYTVVSRPAGGAESQWNLGAVNAAYATLGAVKAAYATLADLQANRVTGA